jgi:hypothetical protein
MKKVEKIEDRKSEWTMFPKEIDDSIKWVGCSENMYQPNKNANIDFNQRLLGSIIPAK